MTDDDEVSGLTDGESVRETLRWVRWLVGTVHARFSVDGGVGGHLNF